MSSAIGEVPAAVLAGQFDLAGAWERVSAKSGMPGVDGIPVRLFARNAEAHLNALESRLARQTYRPDPLRAAELEKKNGSRRLLLVPSVGDRVLQTAVALWLGARWNPQFDPASFAYRPGLGVHDALQAVADMRDRDLRWVLDCDIRSFFDSIDHALLLGKLERWLGPASPLLDWLRNWIRGAVWDGETVSLLERGVPQGSPLSPLLANYYLDAFDARLRSAKLDFIRYADDFLVLARTPFDLAEARCLVESSLAELHLPLNEEKTRIISFASGFRFLGAEIRGEAILLPFAKKKVPKKPVWVAPVMPRQVLRTWRAGHLAPRPWAWIPHRIPAADGMGTSQPKSAWKVVLASLSGPGNLLDRLRSRSL